MERRYRFRNEDLGQNQRRVAAQEKASQTQLERPRLALSGVTDPYQPIERKLRITRSILELLWECRNPVTIITKNALVERDIDLLKSMAAEKLTSVAFSITTLDTQLARDLEPRCSTPEARLRAIETLSKAGIAVFASVAPIIPD